MDTHTHRDCSRNWVLILDGRKYCEKRKVFSFTLKDDRVEQYLRSCGSVMNSKCGVQNKRKCESHESCVCVSACGCQKKSVVQNTKHKMAAPSVLFFATYRRPFKKKVNYKSSKSIASSLFCLNVLIPIDSARDACTLSVPFKVLYVARNSQQD